VVAASESLSDARQELARLSKELTDIHSQKREVDALHAQTSAEKQEAEKQLGVFDAVFVCCSLCR
jgi:phage I-like protein